MSDIKFGRQMPGGKRRIGYLAKAAREGRKILSGVQYAHAVRQANLLKDWGSPEMCPLRIEAVEDFYELKLKGSVLGKTNLRIFFAIFAELIVLLGVYKKEEEGDLPKHVVIRISNRHREAKKRLGVPEKRRRQ